MSDVTYTMEEPMDCTERIFRQPPTFHYNFAENKDEVQVTLSVKWSEGVQPQKCKIELQRALQTWANNKNNTYDGECTVLTVMKDGTAVISLKPAPAVSELQKLSGQILRRRDGETVTIMSVSLTPPELKIQKPEDASVNLPTSSVSEPQHEQVQLQKQRSAVSTAGEETCSLPVGHFWYVNHIYKEEIKRIEKENGVKIMADVNVTFQADQNDGVPQKALCEFTSLVQKCLNESNGSSFPLKYVDQEGWKDMLKISQTKENKLLLTVSSEEMTVCGPIQSQDAVRKSLNLTTNTSTSFGESTWASQEDKPPNIGMSINDPLVNAGLTMEESFWKLMTTSFDNEVAKITTKFGVDFKESDISQGKVEVKAHYRRSEGNASMESHAVRALLHLYQKIAASPMSFTQQLGATGFTGSPSELKIQKPEDASVNLPTSSVSEPQDVGGQLGKQSSDLLTCTCNIPMHHFWYVNQAYKKEIKRIEKESGVKIMAEAKMTFEANQKDGNPNYAFSEFINLVQKCSGESRGFTVPLKKVNPEEWKDVMKIAQRKENTVLLTVSSEEMTVRGPRQSQDAVRKSLNATTNTDTAVVETTPVSQDTSLNIGMSIKDPLIDSVLTMESSRKLMTTTFDEQVAKTKESGISQSKVKACYQRSGGSTSVKSLYLKPATSSMSFTQQHGATAISGSLKNWSNVYQSEGASGGPVMNRQSGYNTEAPTEGGATAGGKRQNAIRKSLNVITNTSTSFGESTWASQEDKPPNIGMSINDPLVNAGLTMEESYWKLMTASFDNQVAKITTKFGVDFKESGISQGKVEVKAHYRRSEGNASMESHAVRALLHLYQKIASSPMSFTQHLGATGSPSEEASGETT